MKENKQSKTVDSAAYKSKEYSLGYTARKGRLELSDNPFKEAEAVFRWRAGWLDADYDTRLS